MSRVYEAIFPRWKPRDDVRPRASAGAGGALSVRWLGAAGHVISTKGTTVLIDPFLSRPPLTRLAFGKLTPDEPAIFGAIPSHVDAILCGHSHFDHLLDAPIIAKRTGAKLVGSGTTCAFARAAGVPEEQLVIVPPGGLEWAIGDMNVRFISSHHGRIFPVGVPFPGVVESPPVLPARLWHYRMGGAFGIRIRAEGASVYHNGSADLVDTELEGERADVLLIGLAGRQSTRNYLARLVDALAPSLIIPTHHDAFFAPLAAGVHLLPRIDLDGFISEVHDRAPRAQVITPDYLEPIVIPPGNARGAFIAD